MTADADRINYGQDRARGQIYFIDIAPLARPFKKNEVTLINNRIIG
jgi:hypothetical protein